MDHIMTTRLVAFHVPPLTLIRSPRHEKDKAVIQCEQLQEQLTEARERPQHSRLPSQEPRSEESMAEATGEASATNVLPGANVKRKLSGDDVSIFPFLDSFLEEMTL